MFTNPLSKTGNLTVAYDQPMPLKNISDKKSKWGAALMAEKQTARVNVNNLLFLIQIILTRCFFFFSYFSQRLNTLSHGQYSQVHKMRTLCSVFRATSLEILKGLSVAGNTNHFVRCIRSTLDYKPRAFQVSSVLLRKKYRHFSRFSYLQSDMVHQQLRALAVLDTAIARQKGFPQRICFQEFLRR